MASLSLVRSGDTATLYAAAGEPLVTVMDVGALDDREALLEAMDAALASAVVVRYGDGDDFASLPLALYNPYTAEVAVGPLGSTVAYAAPMPIPLSPAGEVATVNSDQLVVADQVCAPVVPDRTALAAAWDAHQPW